MTLTSDIILPPDVASSQQAQAWLAKVPVPKVASLQVRFESLDIGAHYFKKLTLSVDKRPLAIWGAQIRSAVVENGDLTAARSWAEDTWVPHVSLMYADIEVTAELHQEIMHMVIESGVRVGEEQRLSERDVSAWTGGRIALVETWKNLSNWKIVASRAI